MTPMNLGNASIGGRTMLARISRWIVPTSIPTFHRFFSVPSLHSPLYPPLRSHFSSNLSPAKQSRSRDFPDAEFLLNDYLR